MDIRFKHSFNLLISGVSGVGKSVFARKLIKHRQEIITPAPEYVLYCYGVWDESYKEIEGVDEFHEGIPAFDYFKAGKRGLVIIDDLQIETNETVAKIFCKGSHHFNFSCVFIQQELFPKNKFARTISLNAHYICVFRNIRDQSQITHLAKQTHPANIAYLQSAYRQATEQPHSYLIIDLTQDQDDSVRLRTNIFPGEIPVVFLPK